MRYYTLFIYLPALLVLTGCGSVEKIARHDYGSGYYRLRTTDAVPARVYVEVDDDSVNVYQVTGEGREKYVDTSRFQKACISIVMPGDYLYNATFVRNSFDIDLTTALLKYRPPQKDVPGQLSANLNAAIYAGLRKDYFHIKSKYSPVKKLHSGIKHFGFDAGFFAGIGITPVNYTVTNYQVDLEYDGLVFEKGIAVYFGIDFLTFGFSLGFDSLLDENHKYWVYNQKPWIGLMLGIANF
jgi:hypothetical protein